MLSQLYGKVRRERADIKSNPKIGHHAAVAITGKDILIENNSFDLFEIFEGWYKVVIVHS